MKKLVNSFCILLLSCFFMFGQTSADEANRNTALRCLKIAESCLMGGDWDNALKQAQLGLTYDENISDLIYVKAAAEIQLNKSKADVIDQIELAFSKNEWVGYTVNGARILYADLLSDVGRYEKSMKVLDEDPFIFSADAEFIRIKNFYRMGTAQALKEARLKINSSRRIYPSDNRFPHLFFMFEVMYLNEAKRIGIEYEIPEIVKTISQSYISKLPDYTGDNLGIELMATFFADDEEKNRLIKAIDAKGQSDNSLLALAGLEIGLYSEQQAFDLFFNAAHDSIHLGLLENFALCLKDDNIKKQFVEKMLNYSGKIFIDEDYDLQPEIIVEYNTGRPQIISYDYNNDGIVDLYCTCDFGAPKFVYLSGNKTKLFYSDFPNVSKITYTDKDYVLNFLNDDFQMALVDLSINNVLNSFGLEFYVPSVSREKSVPAINQLIKATSSIELPIEERNNSFVKYKTLAGKLISADFYENNHRYAYCDFTDGFPVTRHVDQDNDMYFETEEFFNIADYEKEYFTKDEYDYVNKIFSSVAFDSDLYLSKVQIDRNGNTFYEFREQYLGLDGKITTWDNDDNGIPDSQYIKYPREENQQLREDSIFFKSNGEPELIINFLDGVPVKMDYNDSEVMIFAGKSDNFYWIEKEDDIVTEKEILERYGSKLSNGVMDIIQLEDKRISVIKVNDNIFCKILPNSEVIPENQRDNDTLNN